MELEINTAVNLADELERVACLLERESRSHSSAREPERAEARGKPGLIVWREVPGLKREVWEDLRKKGACAGWNICESEERAVPLPASPARFDVRREERTGLWKPLPFMDRMREELERNSGRNAALALFSVASSFEEADRFLCAALWAAARPDDVPGRVDERRMGGGGSGMIALFLPGRSIFQALALAERVAREADAHLAAAGLGVRTRAGVAASANCREDCAMLLRRARQALESSSRRDDAQLEARVRLYREDMSEDGHDVHETLVQASEKRFLFFGGDI